MWGHIHQIYTSTLLRSLKPYSPVHSRRSTCYAPLPPNSLVRRPDPAAVSPSPRRPRLLARRRAVPGSPPVAGSLCHLHLLSSPAPSIRPSSSWPPSIWCRSSSASRDSLDLVPVVVRVALIRPLLSQPRGIWSVTICG